MYSIVLLTAMTTAPEAPSFGRHNCNGCNGGCNGCVGTCYGCYGGCRGCNGGVVWERRVRYSCHGCYGARYGCYGSCHGCYGSAASGRWISVANAARPTATSASIIVSLPEDAKLLVDSNPTTSQGSTRELSTPPLQSGVDFSYTLTATAMRDGKEVRVEKQVSVRAGQVTRLSLEFPREVAQK